MKTVPVLAVSAKKDELQSFKHENHRILVGGNRKTRITSSRTRLVGGVEKRTVAYPEADFWGAIVYTPPVVGGGINCISNY